MSDAEKDMKPTSYKSLSVLLLLVSVANMAGAQPILATGEDAEITADGLQRIHRSIMDAAWVKPGIDLSSYSKVLFMPVAVTFRDVRELPPTAYGRDNDTEFPLDDAAKVRLSTLFGESLRDELAATDAYELYDGVGRDVLMVRGFLTDVASGVPPEVAGVDVDRVRWILEANIIIELRDSMSDEVLARTADRQRAIGPFERLMVPEETRRLVQRWSRLLRTRLEELRRLAR